MQIVFRGQDGDYELDLMINDPAATVADLAAALPDNAGNSDVLVIGGRLAQRDLSLTEAGLYDGVVVSRNGRDGQPTPPQEVATRAFDIQVISGPDAGHTYHLPHGSATIGRGPDNEVGLSDRPVSRTHCRLR